MVAAVLQETIGRTPDIKVLTMDNDEGKEYSASLLPVRGAIQTSYIPHEECPHLVRTQGCTPVGLTSSPSRIGPHCEQSHPREVKTREGETHQTAMHPGTYEVPRRARLMLTLNTIGTIHGTCRTGQLLDVALAQARPVLPHYRGTPHEHQDFQHPIQGRHTAICALLTESIEEELPAYGWVDPLLEGREQSLPTIGRDLCRKAKTNPGETTMPNNNSNHGDLPPLPERAIRGLSSPWSSPTGEPFHTVLLWEFTNLYVLLGEKDWQSLSKYLKGVNLSRLSRQLEIGYYALSNIRDNRNQSIVVPNLCKLCEEAELNLESVERSIRGVRFNTRGFLEHLKFPFAMDIYAWRTLCHIAGDGNINIRKYPDLRWIQLPKHQGPMRELLKRLSRPVGGESDQIWYPKALTYAMMGTMPELTLHDLRSPKFLQFILDLPASYRDWKVEFLAAFIVDDGSISKSISFTQKSETTLQYIAHLCDQLGYDHSHIYRQKRDGVHNFQLRQQGIETFYVDIHKLTSKDPLLGLWHKDPNLQSVATSFSMRRGFDNRQVVEVCLTIISVLGDHKQRDTDELRQHPKINPFLEGQPWYYLGRRLQKLFKLNLIQEVLKLGKTSYRPKCWVIPPSHDPETLAKKFLANYGNRAHKQSYKRKSITKVMVEEIIAQLKAEGVKPTPTAVARRGGFSRKVLYERDDLRRLFEDEE